MTTLQQGPAVDAGDIVENGFASGEACTFEYALAAGEVFAATVMAFGRPVHVEVSGPGGERVDVEQSGNGSLEEVAFTAPADGVCRVRVAGAADGHPRRFAIRVHPYVPPRAHVPFMTRPHPWVAALLTAVQRGERVSDLVPEFWRRVTEAGTPLVDDPHETSPSVCATFVWRGEPDTRQVQLLAAGEWPMTRVPETDVWFKPFPLRRGTRLTYAFLVRRADRPAFLDEARLDPFNPARFPIDATSGGRGRSVLTLTGAPMFGSRLRSAAGATGRVIETTFESRILNNRRRLWVYTPASYGDDSEPCPVIVLFDGEDYLRAIDLPGALDALQQDRVIPPTIAVMVESRGPVARWRELRCEPPIVDALCHELMPWIRQQYRVRIDPASTIVGGASRGGLAAAWVALSAPEIFGQALCQSGSFWWAPDGESLEIERFDPYHEPNWLAREVARRPRVPVRFHLFAGTYEGHDSGQGDILAHTRHLRDVLRAKECEVVYRECLGGHDFLTWRDALPDALAAVLNPPARHSSR